MEHEYVEAEKSSAQGRLSVVVCSFVEVVLKLRQASFIWVAFRDWPAVVEETWLTYAWTLKKVLNVGVLLNVQHIIK